MAVTNDSAPGPPPSDGDPFARLLRSARLELTGRLVDTAVHELNNLLGVILANVSMARESVPVGTPAEEDLGEASRAVGDATNLVRHLRQISLLPPREAGPVDLGAVAADTVAAVRRLVGRVVSVEADAPAGVTMVSAPRAVVQQIVAALVVDARDAMPEGGTIHVRTGAAAPDDGTVTGFAALEVIEAAHGAIDRTMDPQAVLRVPRAGLDALRPIVAAVGGEVGHEDGGAGVRTVVRLPVAGGSAEVEFPE
ncbi:MAG: hypothetical protein AB7O28_01090 [Vicinamibacterales bacterium]